MDGVLTHSSAGSLQFFTPTAVLTHPGIGSEEVSLRIKVVRIVLRSSVDEWPAELLERRVGPSLRRSGQRVESSAEHTGRDAEGGGSGVDALRVDGQRDSQRHGPSCDPRLHRCACWSISEEQMFAWMIEFGKWLEVTSLGRIAKFATRFDGHSPAFICAKAGALGRRPVDARLMFTVCGCWHRGFRILARFRLLAIRGNRVYREATCDVRDCAVCGVSIRVWPALCQKPAEIGTSNPHASLVGTEKRCLLPDIR